MKCRISTGAVLIAALLAPCLALADASTADDRIALSADGGTLTGTNGGGGASAAWLHNFTVDELAGIAIEDQVLADAHWTFGSVNGSANFGPDGRRYSVYGEVHEGAGDDGPHPFHYAIEAVGLIGTFSHRLSVQLEDRQIDVESTHGNLPKAGLSYQWNPHLLTSASYSYSVSGNLGTRLTALRVDEYNNLVNLLAGVSFGQASPAILGIGFVLPPRTLNEGYVGMSLPLAKSRGNLTLVADYQDLSGSKRFTLTLSYVFHVGHTGAAP
jgi:hypothetical protein